MASVRAKVEMRKKPIFMTYNDLLNGGDLMFDMTSLAIFEMVVASGSFTRAAAQGYLTPPAVMHRVAELEKLVGTPLFNRTSQGVTLTAAGETLHRQAPALLMAGENLITKIQHQTGQQQRTIRIGTSALNPASRHQDLWDKLSRQLPDFRFQFIPLETLSLGFPELYQHLGEQVDLLVGPSGFEKTAQVAHFYQLGVSHFTVTMRQGAPLAKQPVVKLRDLAGRRLALVPQGQSYVIDQVYAELARQNVQVTTVAADAHYTIETFNQYVMGAQLLLSFDCWDHVLPGTVTRPLEIPVTIPYGIMAPLVYTPAMAELAKWLVRDLRE